MNFALCTNVDSQLTFTSVLHQELRVYHEQKKNKKDRITYPKLSSVILIQFHIQKPYRSPLTSLVNASKQDYVETETDFSYTHEEYLSILVKLTNIDNS